MKRILFIDDEAHILEGYRRILRSFRDQWEMTFAESGEAGIELLEKQSFDVIVTDMKMPGADGAQVLEAAHARCPQAIRIVLSGYPELEQVVRSISVSHQFLTKPCVAEVLKQAIDRAGRVQSLLADTDLRTLVSRMKELPRLPAVYSQLNRALAEPEVGITDVAPIVERDTAICLKILQLVNSPFFAVSQVITSIAQAMAYIGLDMVKVLVLSSEVFRPSPGMEKVPQFSVEAEQEHALLTANIAKELFEDKKKVGDAFTAGILHDVGKLVLATQLPIRLKKRLEKANKQKRTLSQIEADSGDATHAELGAYLLGTWGFPYCICEAVLGHHHPATIDHDEFDVVDAIHVANVLARRQLQKDDEAPLDELDLEHLERLGVADRVPEWEALAEAISSGS